MRNLAELVWLVIDGKINTPEEGTAALDEEAAAYAAAMKTTEAEARAYLSNLLETRALLCVGEDRERMKTVYGVYLPNLPPDQPPPQG